MSCRPGVDKIFERLRLISFVASIDYNELYLHFFGYYALYINRGTLSCIYVIAIFSQSCQIGHKLYENAVAFYTSDYASYRFTLREARYVFLPAAKQFSGGYVNSAALVNAFYYCINIISDS